MNTTAYHPQVNGLVEQFNRTPLDMLSKTEQSGRQDWDVHLPFVLFAYQMTIQHSARESPFFLMYGRDPQRPANAALCSPVVGSTVCKNDYKSQMQQNLCAAWKLAQGHVKKAQQRQKIRHDKKAKNVQFTFEDKVFVYMIVLRAGPCSL